MARPRVGRFISSARCRGAPHRGGPVTTTLETKPHQAADAHINEIVGFGPEPDGEHEPGCDRPLSFFRRLPHALMVELGLVKGRTTYREALAYLLAEAVLGHQENRAVSVSLNRNFWTGQNRVFGRACSYDNVTAALEIGVAEGLLILAKAPANQRDADGMQSVCFLTPEGVSQIGIPRLERTPRDVLRLRCVDKRYLVYKDDAFTRPRRAQLELVNAMLEGLEIGTSNASVRIYPDGRWVYPKARRDRNGVLQDHTVRTDARSLYAVHNNGSWDQGGRTYGLCVQQLPKLDRADLRIKGERVTLLDYGCSHAVIAYAQVGLPLLGDAYLLSGWEEKRALVKRSLNTAFNCVDERQTIRAIAAGTAKEEAKYRGRDPRKVWPRRAHLAEAAAVLEVIEAHHAAIAGAFYRGSGLKFMRIEADVMLATMLEAQRSDIPLLPVHDEFVTRESDASTTHGLMVKNWVEQVGQQPRIG